jgi:hypothetical protein
MVMLAMELFSLDPINGNGRLGDACRIPKMLQNCSKYGLVLLENWEEESIELNVLFYSMIGFIFVRHMEFGL